ncbi:hypothetical protein BGW80DRAFT_1264805 [Lactifluus volemus]|nr:hypothetical protein BGW80DRAFT_1264805 [Lactifluus volemus]
MSDDDRAAKAARAKALVQAAKESGPATTPTPGSPLVRALSPPPVDPSEEAKSDVTEILDAGSPRPNASELEWLTSLPRVGTPSIVSPREHSLPMNSVAPIEDLRAEVQNQRQTIAVLVSEKMTLGGSPERLSDISTRAREVEVLLRDEQAASERFRERISQLENETKRHSATIEELSRRERDFEEKCREQERELKHTRSSAEGLKTEVEQSQGLIRELQERIQSDDRVAQLEASLQNVQDRAGELEFQLSKSKQAYVSLRADHDKVEATLEQKTTFVSSLETKVSELEGRHATAQKQLTSLTSELQSLRLEKSSLRSQVDDHFGTIAGLRKAAAQSISNEEELNRQLHQTQGELRNAIRRAEEAERIQHELQTEGSTLMRCLDEMRPKIVELTNAKLELSEKTNILEQAVRDRDGVIVQLETSLQAAQDQNESLNTKLLDAESAREKDLSTAQETQDELQRAHASIRELEVERAGRRQLASKQVEDLDQPEGEIASLQQELEERKLADVEQQEFLERARTDIEVLRADLVTKVQEIDELRAELSIAAANSAPSPSLDKEMMNALKQQHRLELSAAQSQIRALQTAIFEAEARAHSFQRQLGQSEDQLAQLRASSSPSSSHVIPRPRARNHSDDLRRVSLTQRRGSNNVSLNSTHSTFGANLSPETRHKRKVSLGMLKARIDSEMAAAAIPPSRAASPQHVGDADSTSPALIPYATTNIHDGHKRPQFLDESHIFWCHSCRGELVVL